MEAVDVAEVLRKIIAVRGAPENTRSDNGASSSRRRCGAIYRAVEHRRFISNQDRRGRTRTAKRSTSRFGDEMLKHEVFDTLLEAKVLMKNY
jgi:hypothetical protein